MRAACVAGSLYYTISFSHPLSKNCLPNPESGNYVTVDVKLIFPWVSFFCSGHVWVYSIYQPIDTISVEPSCNRTLYLFSFWTIIVVYILLGVFLVGSCFYLIYVYKSVRANATNERHLEMNQ